MKTFAERRAERIAELQASAAYDANAPRPLVSPVSKLPTKRKEPKRAPVELHTVAKSVLLYCLDALQAEQATDATTRRRVAAQMLRIELGGR